MIVIINFNITLIILIVIISLIIDSFTIDLNIIITDYFINNYHIVGLTVNFLDIITIAINYIVNLIFGLIGITYFIVNIVNFSLHIITTIVIGINFTINYNFILIIFVFIIEVLIHTVVDNYIKVFIVITINTTSCIIAFKDFFILTITLLVPIYGSFIP